jgi:sialic acid synthase SpsE/sugar phosphate isomerase/epimerase
MKQIKIGNRVISQETPTYIIAEIGINHQGDINLAKKMVDAAVAAKADCAKFQKRTLSKVYKADVLKNVDKEEQAGQYLINNVIKSELTDAEMTKLAHYCAEKKIDFMCTPWDEDSLAFLATLDVPAYKIGSPDMVNLPLIRQMTLLRKPILISTGMSFISEIEQVVRFLDEFNAEYILLHCNSTYPAPFQDINLKFLKRLSELGGGLVGYSGHEKGISVSVAAVALGAKVIERHITLDRTMEGPDHRASLEPDEFADLVREIRTIELSLGEEVRYMSRGEYLNRQVLSKSLVAARDLKKGHVLQYADIAVKSPGKGTNPLKLSSFVGKKLIQRDVLKDEYLLESDVITRPIEYNEYKTNIHRFWGVVARMSDIDQLLECNSDFIEIHLTDSDIKKNRPYKKKYHKKLVIHGPEYNGDLLLNLSSLDEETRKQSVAFFNQAFDHARSLKKLFDAKDELVKFVIHPGGFSMERALLDEIPNLNEQLYKSLKEITTDGFDPLVENMPSCPWFFGGQWYCSNFMDAKEIVAFSKQTGYGIVYDTSHAALYCNYYKKDLITYTKTILPVTKYLHLSDASGVNGEGLQIGDGTIDFTKMLPLIAKYDTWLVPEIWQGHKFNGEGFLKAIHKLKTLDPQF